MLMDDFVDDVIADGLEVDPTDSTYAAQRARVTRLSQQALEIICLSDDWDFLQVTGGTTTVTAGGYSAVAPSGFMKVGSNGSVWIQNDVELKRADPQWVNRIRKLKGTGRSKPEFYAISGQDSTTRRPLIIFDALSDATYTIELDYIKTCPTLVDASDLTTNGLNQIPDEHVRSVLKPAVMELLLSGEGDGRVIGELGPRGKAALASMKAHRNQQEPDGSRLGDLGLRTWGMH